VFVVVFVVVVVVVVFILLSTQSGKFRINSGIVSFDGY
jgi:cell division protein FtsL